VAELTSYRAVVRDRLWALAEKSTVLTAKVQQNLRTRVDTLPGWLKSRSIRSAADLPAIIISDGRATFSAFNDNATFDEENADFDGDRPIVRTYTYGVKIIADNMRKDLTLGQHLEELLQNAFLAGGPKLGAPPDFTTLEYIRPPWGPMAAIPPRDTNAEPAAFGLPVRVWEFSLPVTVELSLAQLLAGVQE